MDDASWLVDARTVACVDVLVTVCVLSDTPPLHLPPLRLLYSWVGGVYHVCVWSSVLQTYSTVLLSYTVLQTDSVAARAVVTKAEGERGERPGLLPRLQGGLTCRQRRASRRHGGQKLAVNLPSDLLGHALSDLGKRHRH